MDLKDIATVSGKGGLYKVVKPTRNGVILESIDEKKQKLVASVHHKVSILDEISIYTLNKEGSLPLADIFKKIFDEFSDDPGVDSKSSKEELQSFLKFILPDYDQDRVYASDIKKLVSWYEIIVNNFPEKFEVEESTKKDKTKDSSDE